MADIQVINQHAALIGLDQTAFPFSRWFHMLVFAWLTVCLCALFPRLRYWQVTAILLGLAVAGELVQIPVPGRTAGVGDLVDDLLGIGLGLAFIGTAWAILSKSPSGHASILGDMLALVGAWGWAGTASSWLAAGC